MRLEGARPVDLVSRGWEGSPVGGAVFTQREFLASPRGRYMAYAAVDGVLRVRDHKRGREHAIDGVRRRDARFSADERWLAALRDSPTHTNGTDLVLLDLARGTTRVLAAGLDHPSWIEWTAGGVVVSHLDVVDTAITYVPLEGEARRIATGPRVRARFTTARRRHRVLYLIDQRVFLADVRRGDPREVGEVPDQVVNLEMAPDGRHAALVTERAIHRVEDDRVGFLVSGAGFHTVWYSADSRMLAYASERGVGMVELGRRSYRLEARVLGARFRAGGRSMVVATGDQAFVWDPVKDTRVVLARAEPGETIDAVDVYDGGAVTWRHRN